MHRSETYYCTFAGFVLQQLLLKYVNMQELLCARYGRSAHEGNTADGRMRSDTVNAQRD